MIPGSSFTVGEGEQHVGEVKHATRFSSAKELPFMSFGPLIDKLDAVLKLTVTIAMPGCLGSGFCFYFFNG